MACDDDFSVQTGASDGKHGTGGRSCGGENTGHRENSEAADAATNILKNGRCAVIGNPRPACGEADCVVTGHSGVSLGDSAARAEIKQNECVGIDFKRIGLPLVAPFVLGNSTAGDPSFQGGIVRSFKDGTD